MDQKCPSCPSSALAAPVRWIGRGAGLADEVVTNAPTRFHSIARLRQWVSMAWVKSGRISFARASHHPEDSRRMTTPSNPPPPNPPFQRAGSIAAGRGGDKLPQGGNRGPALVHLRHHQQTCLTGQRIAARRTPKAACCTIVHIKQEEPIR